MEKINLNSVLEQLDEQVEEIYTDLATNDVTFINYVDSIIEDVIRFMNTSELTTRNSNERVDRRPKSTRFASTLTRHFKKEVEALSDYAIKKSGSSIETENQDKLKARMIKKITSKISALYEAKLEESSPLGRLKQFVERIRSKKQ